MTNQKKPKNDLDGAVPKKLRKWKADAKTKGLKPIQAKEHEAEQIASKKTKTAPNPRFLCKPKKRNYNRQTGSASHFIRQDQEDSNRG